jgi:hypothetical protein
MNNTVVNSRGLLSFLCLKIRSSGINDLKDLVDEYKEELLLSAVENTTNILPKISDIFEE